MVNKTFYTFRKRSSLQIINSQGIGYIINQTTIWPALYLNKTDRSPRESLWLVDTVCSAYLYLCSVKHQPAEACKFWDVREGLWGETITGGQVELLESRTSLGDDLETGFVQEVAAWHFQADQAGTTGLHETKAGDWEKWVTRGQKQKRTKKPSIPQ